MKYFSYILCLLIVISISSLADTGEQKLYKNLRQYKQINGQFTQIISSEQSSKTQSSSGEFWIKKPGQFRWHYTQPYIQKIISDGKKIWIYDEDLEQVTIKNAGTSIKSTPLAIILGGADLDKHFTVEQIAETNELEWLKLSPKSDSSGFEHINLGFKNDTLKRMTLKDNFGQVTKLLFTNVTIYTPIDDEVFQFQVPEATDVFEDAIE